MVKIIYTLNGFLPYSNGGGGAKIVDLTFRNLNKSKKDVPAYLLTENGLVHYKDLFGSSEVVPKSRIRRFVSKNFKNLLLNSTLFYLFIVYKGNKVIKYWNDVQKSSEHFIIHSHLNTAAFKILKKRNIQKHKVIITYHSKGSLSEDLQIRIPYLTNKIRREELFELDKADIITFPSKAAYSLLCKSFGSGFINENKIRIIYNGIDQEKIDLISKKYLRTSPAKSGVLKILNVANHVPQKRFDLILAIAEQLKLKGLQFEIVNIGFGLLQNLHENEIVARDLTNEVKILGKLSNEIVLKHMFESDIFLMTSEDVVFDLVTLEAMYTGMAVILSADGGNLEAVQNGIDGYLIDSNNIEEYCKVIEMLNSDHNLKKLIGDNARQKVLNQFTTEKMVEGYMQLYRDISYKI